VARPRSPPRSLTFAQVSAVFEDPYPVRWIGRQVVVTLPEHIDVSNASPITEELLSLINRGATALIADMTATASCDHAGADAVVRAYHRAAASGTQLRLVVTAQVVRRVLTISGLDRLVSIYPSLEAATAAGAAAAVVSLVPARAVAGGGGPARPSRAARTRNPRPAAVQAPPGTAAVSRAVLLKLIDSLADGVALADDDGKIVLVNRRLEDTFGYERSELVGRPVEALIPADLRAAHRGHRAAYAQAPRARPMGDGIRLAGLRKDGTTFPVKVSLNPVLTATGHLTLAVIRDITEARQPEDLLDLARAAVAAEQAYQDEELLDRVVDHLFNIGLMLQAAIDLPHDVARERIAEALEHLDDTIHEIRDHGFTTRQQPPPGPATHSGAQ
jgi:anti-anti-sigma factor